MKYFSLLVHILKKKIPLTEKYSDLDSERQTTLFQKAKTEQASVEAHQSRPTPSAERLTRMLAKVTVHIVYYNRH